MKSILSATPYTRALCRASATLCGEMSMAITRWHVRASWIALAPAPVNASTATPHEHLSMTRPPFTTCTTLQQHTRARAYEPLRNVCGDHLWCDTVPSFVVHHDTLIKTSPQAIPLCPVLSHHVLSRTCVRQPRCLAGFRLWSVTLLRLCRLRCSATRGFCTRRAFSRGKACCVLFHPRAKHGT